VALFELQNAKKWKKKNAVFFQLKFGSNMDKPKCWVKNVSVVQIMPQHKKYIVCMKHKLQ